MGITRIPDFGDVVGLRRLYRAAIGRTRQRGQRGIPGGREACWDRGTDQAAPGGEGGALGLYRLVRWAKARVRASARPPAERAAILAEIERQYRAALESELAERQLGERPTE